MKVEHKIRIVSDSIGLHRVENVSNVDTAISLHLYCPPYEKCSVFNQNTGQKSTSTVTFYSMFGKRNKVKHIKINIKYSLTVLSMRAFMKYGKFWINNRFFN